MPINLLMSTARFFFDAEKGGGSGGGGQEETVEKELPIDENHPIVKELVKGLKTKNSEVIGKNKEFAERLKLFEGLDPDEVKEAVDSHRKAKDRKLMDEGKVEELLEQRTSRMKADFDAQIKAKDKKIEELAGNVSSLEVQLRDSVLGSSISQACVEANIRPQAVGLVRKLATDTWKVEDGLPRAYDQHGPVMGKDTKPISVKEWVEGLRGDHEYLFKESFGGGAGNKESGGKANGSLKRSEMTPAEKSKYVSEHGREAFLNLPA